MKTDKGISKVSRIDVERLVLKSLKGKKSRYLPKYYETAQKIGGFTNFLLLDFYPQKSL